MQTEIVEDFFSWISREASNEDFFIQWKYLLNKEKLSKWMVPPFNEIWNFFIFRSVSKKNIDKVICTLKLNGLFEGYCDDIKETHIKTALINMRIENERKYNSMRSLNTVKSDKINQLMSKISKINNTLSTRKKDLSHLLSVVDSYKKAGKSYNLLENVTKKAILNVESLSSKNIRSIDDINIFSDIENKYKNMCQKNKLKISEAANIFAHMCEIVAPKEGLENINKVLEKSQCCNLIKPLFLKQNEIHQQLYDINSSNIFSSSNFPQNTFSLLPSLTELYNQRCLKICALKELNIEKSDIIEKIGNYVTKLNIDAESSEKIISTLKLMWTKQELEDSLQYLNSLTTSLKISSANYSNISAQKINSTYNAINSHFSKLNEYCHNLPQISVSIKNELKLYSDIKYQIKQSHSNINDFIRKISNMQPRTQTQVSTKNSPSPHAPPITRAVDNNSITLFINKFIEILKVNINETNQNFENQLRFVNRTLVKSFAESCFGILMSTSVDNGEHEKFLETSLSHSSFISFTNQLRNILQENQRFQQLRLDIKSLMVSASLTDDKLCKMTSDLNEWWTSPAFLLFEKILTRS